MKIRQSKNRENKLFYGSENESLFGSLIIFNSLLIFETDLLYLHSYLI